jgi:hypothetical protein
VEGLARMFYGILNMYDRPKQSVEIQNYSFQVQTFTDVITEWLTIPNSSLKDLANGFVQYMVV